MSDLPHQKRRRRSSEIRDDAGAALEPGPRLAAYLGNLTITGPEQAEVPDEARRALFDEQRYAASMEALKTAIGAGTNEAERHYGHGLACIDAGQIAEGISAFRMAIEEGAREGRPLYVAEGRRRLAFVLAAIGKTKEALKSFLDSSKVTTIDQNQEFNQKSDWSYRRFLQVMLLVEEIRDLLYDELMDEIDEKLSELSALTGVPANAMRDFIANFRILSRGTTRPAENDDSDRHPSVTLNDSLQAVRQPATDRKGATQKRSANPAKVERTIAGLQASLAELCKIDLSSVTPEDEAVRQARNLAGTADRLKARGVRELPAYAVEPVRHAYRLVRAYHRRKAKGSQL